MQPNLPGFAQLLPGGGPVSGDGGDGLHGGPHWPQGRVNHHRPHHDRRFPSYHPVPIALSESSQGTLIRPLSPSCLRTWAIPERGCSFHDHRISEDLKDRL